MVYRRVGKGVLVYSLGPDMKDSGGEFKHPPHPLTQTQPAAQTEPPDDVAIRMNLPKTADSQETKP